MYTERVDGYNPLAVIDAIKRKRAILEEKKGPVLLDTLTYRYSGHSPSDSSSYRTKEEIEAWEEHDVLKGYSEKLISAKVLKKADFDEMDEKVEERMLKVFKMATDDAISPRMDLFAVPNQIEDIMFSNEKIESMDTERKPDVLLPMEECPRVVQIAKKTRFAFDENGKPVSKNKVFQLRDALFEAIIEKYYQDPTLISYGEDVRDWGGAFAVYRGLTETIPYHRLFNSPIVETGF